jgi:hypothetical protein
MKICNLAALPVLAQSQDDTSTLLSLRAQVSLETGVDHLLDAVGSRNVTQMSSLLQNLVEETISDGPYQLDGDVKTALEVIKDQLLGDIRGALNEAHCYDQVELHNQILCFKGCEDEKATGAASCIEHCDGSSHKMCRDGLLVKYKEHIEACQALDNFVMEIQPDCPVAKKKCCLLSHTTWNCGGLCAGQISKMDVDGYFGGWLQTQIVKFEGWYAEWTNLHLACKVAYHAYVEEDAKCDCKQAECETQNCQYEACHYLNCEDRYNKCWGSCEGEYKRTNEAKECLEKDRKIDWSATEKIECYVDVLLKQPAKDELLATCGKDNCINEYREIMYKHCNLICPEVDTDFEWGEHDRRVGDQDVTAEGVREVRTQHRSEDASAEAVRCTSHLDLDYQVPPCCHPCEPRPEPPCTDSYIQRHYGQFGHFSKDVIAAIDEDNKEMFDTAQKCHVGEHTKVYAFNLCNCEECDELPTADPATCTAAKECSGYPAQYDYGQHEIKVDCAAVSDVEVTPYATNHEVEEE